MSGAQAVGAFGLGAVSNNWSIVGQRDFNNDGHYDLLWRDASTGNDAILAAAGGAVDPSAAHLLRKGP